MTDTQEGCADIQQDLKSWVERNFMGFNRDQVKKPILGQGKPHASVQFRG